ncbi:hypothetical protein Hanom_Chr16g01425911 [Helianthus anomalus]
MYVPKNFYTKTTYSPLLSEKFGGRPPPPTPKELRPCTEMLWAAIFPIRDTVHVCILIMSPLPHPTSFACLVAASTFVLVYFCCILKLFMFFFNTIICLFMLYDHTV